MDPDFTRPPRSSKNPLELWLGIALGSSLLLSLLLASLFWYLGSNPGPWTSEHFFNQPLGMVTEPFETYSHFRSTERQEDPGSTDNNIPAVELGSQPSDLFEQWVLEEYLAKTKNPDPYQTSPFPKTPAELSERRAAFARYDKEMETERDVVEASVNKKVFLFDLAIYLALFATCSSFLAVIAHSLIRRPAPRIS